MVLSFLTRGFLIAEPAPEAQGSLLTEAACDYFHAQAGMSLNRSDVIDAGVVVLGIIRVTIYGEVSDSLAVVQELIWLVRRGLNGGGGRFDKGIFIGRARTGKQVRIW